MTLSEVVGNEVVQYLKTVGDTTIKYQLIIGNMFLQDTEYLRRGKISR